MRRPQELPGGLERGRARILASVDYWDDRYDVYRVQLRRGERIRVSVQGKAGTDTNLVLWKPGVRRIGAPASRRLMAGRSTGPGATESVTYAAKQAGWYFVQVSMSQEGSGAYSLRLDRAG